MHFYFKKNVVQTLDEKKVKEWMIVHFSKIMKPGFNALVLIMMKILILTTTKMTDIMM